MTGIFVGKRGRPFFLGLAIIVASVLPAGAASLTLPNQANVNMGGSRGNGAAPPVTGLGDATARMQTADVRLSNVPATGDVGGVLGEVRTRVDTLSAQPDSRLMAIAGSHEGAGTLAWKEKSTGVHGEERGGNYAVPIAGPMIDGNLGIGSYLVRANSASSVAQLDALTGWLNANRFGVKTNLGTRGVGSKVERDRAEARSAILVEGVEINLNDLLSNDIELPLGLALVLSQELSLPGAQYLQKAVDRIERLERELRVLDELMAEYDATRADLDGMLGDNPVYREAVVALDDAEAKVWEASARTTAAAGEAAEAADEATGASDTVAAAQRIVNAVLADVQRYAGLVQSLTRQIADIEARIAQLRAMIEALTGQPVPPLDGGLGSDDGTGLPGTDGGTGLPGTDGGTGLPGTDGGTGLPGTDGGTGLPGTDGGTGLPGTDGGTGLPGTDGGTGLPDTDGGTGLPGTGTGSGGVDLPDEDAGDNEGVLDLDGDGLGEIGEGGDADDTVGDAVSGMLGGGASGAGPSGDSGVGSGSGADSDSDAGGGGGLGVPSGTGGGLGSGGGLVSLAAASPEQLTRQLALLRTERIELLTDLESAKAAFSAATVGLKQAQLKLADAQDGDTVAEALAGSTSFTVEQAELQEAEARRAMEQADEAVLTAARLAAAGDQMAMDRIRRLEELSQRLEPTVLAVLELISDLDEFVPHYNQLMQSLMSWPVFAVETIAFETRATTKSGFAETEVRCGLSGVHVLDRPLPIQSCHDLDMLKEQIQDNISRFLAYMAVSAPDVRIVPPRTVTTESGPDAEGITRAYAGITALEIHIPKFDVGELTDPLLASVNELISTVRERKSITVLDSIARREGPEVTHKEIEMQSAGRVRAMDEPPATPPVISQGLQDVERSLDDAGAEPPDPDEVQNGTSGVDGTFGAMDAASSFKAQGCTGTTCGGCQPGQNCGGCQPGQNCGGCQPGQNCGGCQPGQNCGGCVAGQDCGGCVAGQACDGEVCLPGIGCVGGGSQHGGAGSGGGVDGGRGSGRGSGEHAVGIGSDGHGAGAPRPSGNLPYTGGSLGLLGLSALGIGIALRRRAM